MKKQQKSFVLYALLALTTFSSGYFFVRSSELQDELAVLREQVDASDESEKNTFLMRLVSIDSLLLNEHYSEARKAYESLLQEIPKDDAFSTAVHLGMHNMRKLEGMRAKIHSLENEESYEILTAKMAEQTREVDSISSLLAVSRSIRSRQYDSLTFALEKANIRSKSLKSQIAQLPQSNYLKFIDKDGMEVFYVGGVKDKLAYGKGVGLYSNGNRYEGEWKANERHGKGTFYWSDGEYYVGNYYQNERQGQGNYYWPNGDKFTGLWQHDKRNGIGTFYGKDGKTVASGNWKNNKLIDREGSK
ncbi:MAG: hypothetical protein AAF694_25420 [Bacteroidota bacterium]